jgi:hypothetical protein
VAWAALANLAHDDEDLYDMSKGMPEGYEPSEYPSGCCFSVSAEDLERAGCEGGEPGDTCRFSAMGEVTAIHKSIDGCRIEIQLGEFAGEDGKFFDLEQPGYICLCERELGKMGLEADCERGDMIHLIGTLRMESTSSTEYGGDMCSLQIVELAAEDESQESREG